MRAILINPYNQTISEVEGDFDTNYTARGSAITEPGIHTVGHFDVLRVAEDAVMFVDDDGHLAAGRACFGYVDYDGTGQYPLAGRALITGCNDEGDTVDASMSVADVVAKVRWLGVESTGSFGPSSEGYVDHPSLGRVWQLTGGQPIVRPRT